MPPGEFLRDENQLKEWNLQPIRPQLSYGDLFHVKHSIASIIRTSHCARDGDGGLLALGPIRRGCRTVVHKVIHSDIHRTMHRHSPTRAVIDARRSIS